MPPPTSNFAAHGSLDVSQGCCLLPRRSFILQSEPGAAAVERPPARPRNARDGGAGGGDDGLGLSQGGGRTGLGGHRDGGRLAPSCGVLLHRAPPAGRSVTTEPPPRWPVAAMGPLPREPPRPGCLGPPDASSELRLPGPGEPQRRRGQPPPRPAADRPRPRAARACGGRGGGDKAWPRGAGTGATRSGRRGRRSRSRLLRTSGCAATPPPPLLGRWRWWCGCRASVGSGGTDGVSGLQGD